MFYLFLAVMSSAAIPMLFRLAQIKKCRQAPVLTFNYIVCILFVAVLFFVSGGSVDITFSGEAGNSLMLAAAIGIVCGGLYYLGFVFYQKSVRASGVAMSSAFGKMGVIVPVLLSAIVWREYPTIMAVAGILVALFAVFLSFFELKSFRFKNLHSVLIVFFLVGGLGDFSNKVFQKYCLAQHEFVFLFFIFGTALLFSLKPTLKDKKPAPKEMLLGVALGIPNMLTSFFLIRSLYALPAYVVFPTFSGGTIVFSLILSLVIYRDKLSSRQLISIALIAIAMVLINI